MSKTTKTAKAIVIAAALCALGTTAIAQTKDTNVYNEKVVVVGSFNPVLQNADKLNIAPSINDTATMTPEYNYAIESRRIYSLYMPESIKPARIKGEPTSRLYHNYIKLGFGNYCTPYADIYYNSTRSKDLNYGARAYHKSSWWTLKDYGKNHSSNTEVDIFGKKIWAKNSLSANVFYNHDYNLYYGFTDSLWQTFVPDADPEKPDYSQYYNTLGMKAEFRSTNMDYHKLNYEANMLLINQHDKYASNELRFAVDADAHYGFTFWGTEKQILGLTFQIGHYRNTGDSTLFPMQAIDTVINPNAAIPNYVGNTTIIAGQPYFLFKAFGFKMNIGLKFAWANNDGFKLFPNVTLSQTLFNDILHLTAGINSDFIHNSWQSLRVENPFVGPRCETQNTSYNKLFAEAKFNFTKKFNAYAGVSYTLYKQLPFFMLDTLYQLNNVYKTIYADANVLNINAGAAYHLDELFSFGLKGNIYKYNMKEGFIEKPLYKPGWDAYLTAAYNYNNKFYARVEAGLLGKMNGLNRVGNKLEEEKLAMKYGIHLDMEYRVTKALSFFADLDNIAYQRYYFWSNYPSKRIQFLLGLTYTIPVK